MKKAIYFILTIITGIFFSVIISCASVFWVVKADGKNIYEILNSLELILRFGAAIITFSVLVFLYIRFVFCPLAYKSIYD